MTFATDIQFQSTKKANWIYTHRHYIVSESIATLEADVKTKIEAGLIKDGKNIYLGVSFATRTDGPSVGQTIRKRSLI